jgi:hypothetical protein
MNHPLPSGEGSIHRREALKLAVRRHLHPALLRSLDEIEQLLHYPFQRTGPGGGYLLP